MPGSLLAPAIAGVGGQFAEDDCVHHIAIGFEQSDFVAVVVESKTGLLAIEDRKRTGLEHRPGWNPIRCTVAFRIVEEPAAEVNDG